MPVIISCAGDSLLAKELHEYILSNISLLADSDTNIGNDPIASLTEDEIEVRIDGKASRLATKEPLNSFLKTDPNRFKDYNVVEFGDAFIVGITVDLSRVGMQFCEICGFSTPHSSELYTHRLAHGFIP